MSARTARRPSRKPPVAHEPVNLVAPYRPAGRFGKHPPKRDYRTLRFADYAALLAAPPSSCDNLGRVAHALPGTTVAGLFPMDGNDTLGDCTIAAVAHAIGVYRGLTGVKTVMAKADVTKLYFKLSGGVDSGLNELDVLNYWRKTAVDGDAIAAYVSIDPKNHVHVQQAIDLFGGVYIGFQVQANCIQEFNAHKPWIPGKLTNDGHAVFAVGYSPTGGTVLTWGALQQFTWAWWDECVDECYAILPPEAKSPKFAPGFNYQQLVADLKAITG